MNSTNQPNIMTINNLDKYNIMIQYLINNQYIPLSMFLQPWIYQQKDANTELYNGHTLFESKGNYFEFLRWLTFKMMKEDKYINQQTYSLLIYFENGMDLTGIFRIKKGGLYNLLSSDKLSHLFYHTPEIITISNSQLVMYIDNKLSSNKSMKKETSIKKETSMKKETSIKKETSMKKNTNKNTHRSSKRKK